MEYKQYGMEFIGTFFLVLSIALTGNPLAFGLVFMTMVYIGGHISGAHYNPAVTVAVMLNSSMPLKKVVGYVVSQLLGGIAAAVAYYGLSGSPFSPDTGMGIVGWKAFVIEILFTYVLVLAILSATRIESLKSQQLHGVIIGFAFLGIAFMGGVYNPAVAFGPMVFDTFVTGASALNLLIYILAPVAGGMFAAYSFKVLNKV